MSTFIDTPDEAETDEWSSTVSLSRLWASCVRGWKILAGAIGVFLILAILYLAIASPRYEADLLIAPAPSATTMSPMGGLGSAGASGMGSVVSSFLGLQTTGTPDFLQFLDAMTSYEVADRMERKYHFLEQLMPGQWDSNARRWKRPWGASGIVNAVLYGIMGVSAWHPPGAADLKDFLEKNLTIASVGVDTDSRLVSLNLANRELARAILLADFEEANAVAKQRALERSTVIIKYANDRLNRVSVVVGRDVLTDILNQNIGQQLLASTPLPYAAQMRDQVHVSDLPVSPKPLTVIMLAFVAGILMGGGLVIFRYY